MHEERFARKLDEAGGGAGAEAEVACELRAERAGAVGRTVGGLRAGHVGAGCVGLGVLGGDTVPAARVHYARWRLQLMDDVHEPVVGAGRVYWG